MRNKTDRSNESAEVVMMDDQPIVTNRMDDVPHIATLNVTRSSRVHLGPKFVNVNQTVHHSEVIKGQVLGLELVSANTSRRLRCSIAVFVCWASLVAAVIATAGISYYAFNERQIRLDIGLNEPWYLRRDDWQAMPSYEVDYRQLPLQYVMIGHSAENYCNEKYSCIEQILIIQQDNMRRGYNDIGPNFLLSGNGLVFEGRAVNVIPAMVVSWNTKSIAIMFMGDYTRDPIQQIQLDHLSVLLEVLVKDNVLRTDYVIYGHCQVATQIVSPGRKVIENMNQFSHWNSSNANLCLPG